MLQKCRDKPNLVMVCHTNYDHIFCIFLRNPIKQDDDNNLASSPKDSDIGLFSLRSQFIHGHNQINKELLHKTCPRIIKAK